MTVGKMNKRTIANTSIAVSPIGLGTVKLGRDQGVKYPESFTIPDNKAASHLIDLAKELGINLIDTAPAYGNSEERLGHLLKGQRQDWVICSKVGEEYEHGQSSFDFSAAHIQKSIERSLARLKTDYIDIVLVHSDGNDRSIIENGETLSALEQCKQAGLIRSYGMSTKTVAGGLLAADKTDIVMASYNPDYRDEAPVIEYCAENNKAVFIKKALASGHFSSDAKNADPLQASMDFIFAQPGVTSVIMGTINPQHLTANVAAVERALAKRT
jgi:aryl-alcohol dehydrogenase-like predicted oxidoreductase